MTSLSMPQTTTWYLTYQGELCALPEWPATVTLIEATRPSADFSQFLFCAVGHHWRWFSRLSWTYPQWQEYVQQPSVRTWVLYQQGVPAGFFELRRHTDASIELTFFGLLPAMIGQGLGRSLLQAAIHSAQQWEPATRLWVHTCSADHPAALGVYQRAGFVVIDTHIAPYDVPDDYATLALAAPFVMSRMAFFAEKDRMEQLGASQ